MVSEQRRHAGHWLLLWVSWVLVCGGAGVAASATGQFVSWSSGYGDPRRV